MESPEGGGEPGGRRRRLGILAGLFLFVFVIHLASPNAFGGADGRRAIPVAVSMVHRQTISIDTYRDSAPPDYTTVEIDGHLYPAYPWGVSLLAVPMVLVVDGFHALGVGPGVDGRIAAVDSNWEFEVLTMSFVVAATAAILFTIALELLHITDERRRCLWALASALAFAFCTAAWSTASRSYWQHGPMMLCLSLALLAIVKARNNPRAVWAAGPALAASYVMRPTGAIPFIGLSVWVFLAHRRQTPVYLAGAGAILALFITVNLSAYGQILPDYYLGSYASGDVFSEERHIWEALAGNLVSPGRGLFVFSPILLLAPVGLLISYKQRALHSLHWIIVFTVLLHLLFVSMFPNWWGGFSYGPRFMTDVLPLLFLLALPAVEWLAGDGGPANVEHIRFPLRSATTKIALALAVISFLFHLPGALFLSSTCWNAQPLNVDRNPSRLWDWSDPQFLRGWNRFFFGPDRLYELSRGGISIRNGDSEIRSCPQFS